MKLNCRTTDLIDTLNSVSKAIKTNANPAILGNVLITASEGKVVLNGYDGELGIECVIDDADILEDGVVAVSPKMLGDMAKKMLVDELTLYTEDNKYLVVVGGKSKMRIQYLDGESYPKLPVAEDATAISVSGASLKSVLSTVTFAVSRDATKAVLAGANLICENGKLTAIGCDGFRFALCNTDIEGDYNFNIIVPLISVNEVIRAIGNDDNVAISLSSTLAIFDIGGVKITSRLIGGNYPNVRSLIKDSATAKIFVSPTELYKIMDRADLVVSEAKNRTPVTIKGNTDNVTVSCMGSTSEFKEVVECVFEGNELDIDFNCRFVLDALKNADDEKIEIDFSGNQGGALIKPTTHDNFIFLVLPIRR